MEVHSAKGHIVWCGHSTESMEVRPGKWHCKISLRPNVHGLVCHAKDPGQHPESNWERVGLRQFFKRRFT